jgi:hypothetical protein
MVQWFSVSDFARYNALNRMVPVGETSVRFAVFLTQLLRLIIVPFPRQHRIWDAVAPREGLRNHDLFYR